MLHILADFREECEPLPPERVMQGLRDGAPLTQELTDERLHKLGHGGTVVDMPWGQPTGQPCTLIVDDKMQLEALEPPHRGLPPCGEALEDPVCSHAMIVTHREGRRVDTSNPRAAAFAGGEVATQGHERSGPELDKALVAHPMRARGAQGHRHILRRVMLKGPVMTPVAIDQEGQYLAACQRRLAGTLALADMQQAVRIDGLKGLAAIVDIAEDSHQCVQRGSLGCGVDSWWNQPRIQEPLSVSRSKLIPNSRYLHGGVLTGAVEIPSLS